MKTSIFISLALLLLVLSGCNKNKEDYKPDVTTFNSPKGTKVFKPDSATIAQNYKIPEWFKDAKFGIFIHWGVYSVPAFGNEWYPRNMYVKGSPEFEFHIENFGKHLEFGYKDFIPQFKAEKFDPKSWAELFKESGARYVVPVAEHHDGFAMYDCSFSKWNAVNMGPKRDVIGELAQAVREAGLSFGCSFHRAENWWYFNGGKEFPSDVQDIVFLITTAMLHRDLKLTPLNGEVSIGFPDRMQYF